MNGVDVDRLHDICALYDIDPQKFWKARERHDEQSQFEDFRAGAREQYDDVTVLTEIRHNCGVVSNNHHSTIEFKLDFFDLRSQFDTYYGRQMTIESLTLKKPNTHYLDQALDDLGAESALYVGDSESDVVAASRAGVDSAFVQRSHCRDVELSVTPTYEVESLHEIPSLVH
jgi:HAD superfamily hydrolase (TIGR01549 family)